MASQQTTSSHSSKKGSTSLMGTLVSFLMGMVLIVAAPSVLWKAENQHRADDFKSADEVELTEVVDGYVTLQGTPEVTESVTCIDEECLFAELHEQELITKEMEQCGKITEDEYTRILYKTRRECDDEGDCKQCYQIEKDVWEDQNVEKNYGEAKLGEYTVGFNSGALMLGLENKTVQHTDYLRDLWTYFPIPAELRVAGEARNGRISGAELTYVLSPFDYGQTLKELVSIDTSNKWMFRVLSLVMLFLGFAGLFAPLKYVAHLVSNIPAVGKIMQAGTNAAVGFASTILAVISWVMLWILITFLKNILWVSIIVGIAVAAFLAYLWINKKK